MSRSEPSSPRTGNLLRQFVTIKQTTDELARLWHKQVTQAEDESKDSSTDDINTSSHQSKQSRDSLRLRSLKNFGRTRSSPGLDSLAVQLSKSGGLGENAASSVISDLSELLIFSPATGEQPKKKNPKLHRAQSAGCITTMKFATPASQKKAAGDKLNSYFGVSQADLEFSQKHRKLIRMFGQDFPSHANVLATIADNKRQRDCDIHRPLPKLYSEGDASEEQIRQRKKLESFAGLTEEDYDSFMLQLKLFHKLGEHVPLEELRKKQGRSQSIPPELEMLDANASKVERMLGAKKEQIAGQDKSKKAARIFGESLPRDYCEEIGKLDQAPEKISLHSRKISQPITDSEMKRLAKGKKLTKSNTKKFLGFSKKKPAPKKEKTETDLAIMGTGIKSGAKSKGVKSGLPPVKGARAGKALRK